MKANESFPKPEFKVPPGYFKSLETELLKIPEDHPRKVVKPQVFWIRTMAAATAVILLALFIPWGTEQNSTLTDQEIAAYIESDGAWLLEELAFDEALSNVTFEGEVELDEWNDLLFIEGVEDDFWYDESM